MHNVFLKFSTDYIFEYKYGHICIYLNFLRFSNFAFLLPCIYVCMLYYKVIMFICVSNKVNSQPHFNFCEFIMRQAQGPSETSSKSLIFFLVLYIYFSPYFYIRFKQQKYIFIQKKE